MSSRVAQAITGEFASVANVLAAYGACPLTNRSAVESLMARRCVDVTRPLSRRLAMIYAADAFREI